MALSRECRFLDELKYHVQANWHGVEDASNFMRRMQVRPYFNLISIVLIPSV